jgi:starch synthase
MEFPSARDNGNRGYGPDFSGLFNLALAVDSPRHMHLLHAASELHPFSKTGGLADMVAALAKTLAGRGAEVSIVTPFYRSARERAKAAKPLNWHMDVPVGDRLISAGLWKLEVAERLTVYFVEQPGFFDRAGIYQENRIDYGDNAERFIFFSKVVALLSRLLPSAPQVVHAHDWQTGLVPLLIRHARDREGWMSAPSTVLTVHNLAYQGVFPAPVWGLTGLPRDYFNPDGAEFHSHVNLLKAGLAYADELTTVSPNYALEITRPEFGCGLEGLLRHREDDLVGILNGVDYQEWNTNGNPYLPASFNPSHLKGKAACKAALQSEMGLPARGDVPLFANISRLEEQKGSDLLPAALEETLGADFQFVLLGSGQPRFEALYRQLAARHPGKVAAQIGFDAALAHRIEAAADFYLMPSRFEPCGLNQLYSLRYGAVPVVRDTGGLHDSVVDVRESAERATGIKFREPAPETLAHAIRKALVLYRERELLAHFRRNGMTADFSWDRSADEYLRLYQRLVKHIRI